MAKKKGGSEPKRLYRSEKDRIFGGVAAGIAEYFNVDPLLIRFIFILIVLCRGAGLLLYLVLWVILPRASKVAVISEKTIKENVEEIKERAEDLAEEIRGLKKSKKTKTKVNESPKTRSTAGK